MKRTIDYRFEQKVRHGELAEATIDNEYETVVYKSDSEPMLTGKSHRMKRKDSIGTMQDALDEWGFV